MASFRWIALAIALGVLTACAAGGQYVVDPNVPVQATTHDGAMCDNAS